MNLDLRRKLGKYLQEKRLEMDYTQADIAQYLGYISPQFISNWERGISNIPLHSLKRLIPKLGLSVEIVLDFFMDDSKFTLRSVLTQRSHSRKKIGSPKKGARSHAEKSLTMR